MVLEKEILMVINQYNIEYYKSKGYLNINIGNRIYVKIEDLPSTSGVKVHVVCDYCGKVFVKSYRKYYETQNDVCCKECRKKKILKITMKKYGVRSTLRLPEVEKKVKESNLRKFGVEMPLQSEEIREKAKDTMEKRYGVKYTLQNTTLREKVNTSMRNNNVNCVSTSSQQKLLCDVFNGELNFPIGPYFVDIFLKKDNICVEYDGSGHDLSVKIGKLTRSAFEAKEKERLSFLIEKGYRVVKIISKTDLLPQSEKLYELKNLCLEKIKNNNFYLYNLDDLSESFEW